MTRKLHTLLLLVTIALLVVFGMGPTCDEEGGESGPVCGDGTADPGEDCDGSALRDQDCASLFHGTGQLGCNQCRWDFAQCSQPSSGSCGNQTAEAGEDCDSPDLRNQTCATLWRGSGELGCYYCRWDTSGCEHAGQACVTPLYITFGPLYPQVTIFIDPATGACSGVSGVPEGFQIVLDLMGNNGGGSIHEWELVSISPGSMMDGGFVFDLEAEITMVVRHLETGKIATIVFLMDNQKVTVFSVTFGG